MLYGIGIPWGRGPGSTSVEVVRTVAAWCIVHAIGNMDRATSKRIWKT